MKAQERIAWRVLHVDDDEEDFLIAREMLKLAQGSLVSLEWAATFAEAEARLLAARYDAVLVDYDLGERTGIEFIQQVTAQGYPAPLILFTGRGNYEVDVEAMKAGATLYLTKDEVNPLLLERSIRYAIERKRIERERSDILESIQDGFFAVDRDWKISFINKTAAAAVQARPEELIGLNIWEAFPEMIGTSIEIMYQHVMEQREAARFEAKGLYEGPWYEISVYPFQDGISIYWQDISEKKKATEALRRSEVMHRAIARNLPEGAVVVVNEQMRYLIAEGSLWSMWGIGGEDIEGQTLRETLDPDLAEDEEERFRHALAGQTSSYESDRFGRVVWAQYLPLLDEEGKVLAAMALALDISERKWAEESLKVSEYRQRQLAETLEMERALLAAVLENLPVGVWVARLHGELILKNQEADRIWAGEAPLLENIEAYPEYKAWFADSGMPLTPEDYPVAKALRTGQPVAPLELKIQRFDGSQGTVLVSATPLKDQSGETRGVVGVNVDISERKMAENELRLSEERFQKAFNTSPNTLVVSRMEDGQIEMINDAFEKQFGYKREEVLGRTSLELNLFADPRQREEIVQEMQAQGFLRDCELDVRKRSGEIRRALLSAERLLLDGEDFILTILTDITEQKKGEETLKAYARELERSNRDLQEFAFVASHDLQEPLRKIETLATLIESQDHNLSSEQLEHLALLRKSARRMQTLVSGLLQLSRLSTHAQPFEQVDLGEVVKEVLVDLEVQVRRSKGCVEVSNLPVVEADPIQMRQLFQNLIGNALKFQPEERPPLVKVTSSRPSPETVEIQVRDNGIGFDAAQAERIFQPFQRLVGRSEYEGSGMGLALCRKIVQRHGGEIQAQSKPGEGSAFIVTLPVAQQKR